MTIDLDKHVIVSEGGGIDEVQTWTLTGVGAGKNWTAQIEGEKTANILGNATAATVQSRLEALSNIDAGDVTVSGAAGGPYTVSYVDGQYADEDAPTPVFTAEEGSVASTEATKGVSPTSAKAVRRGTGLADRETSPVNPLTQATPKGDRTANSGGKYA